MPFDLVGFGEAAPGANGTLAVLLKDDLYTTSGDDLKIKATANLLLGIWCYGEATLGKTKLSQTSLPQDYAFMKGTVLASPDPNLAVTDHRGRPLPLVADENVNCSVVNAGDEDDITFLMLGNAPITRAMIDAVAPTHRITGYADDTLTAFTWTNLTMTWNQKLPKGRYAVVGMRYAYFKSSVAMPGGARLVFKEPHAAGYRPGVVGSENVHAHLETTLTTLNEFTMWPKMANMDFDSDNMPGVQAVGAEAHTDEDVELLLQRIS